MTTDAQGCKVCGAAALEEVADFRLLPRVTSDCVPFRDGGRLLICGACGAAQSPADAQWFQEIGEIYGAYDIYHQSGGVEQYVLDPAQGTLRRRSEVVLDKLLVLDGVTRSGKVLDVGCGTGGTLKAFAARGGWRLYGLEIDNRNLPFLTAIPGFEKLYTCTPAELPDSFDLVAMVHSLEHFPEPQATLRDLRGKIALGGHLFVEVPNAEANPFEYLVADHMVHFTPSTLGLLARNAGYGVDCLATTWITKELSLTAHPDGATADAPADSVAEVAARIRGQIDWLRRFVDQARVLAAGPASFGIFGASIAATWLCGVLGERVAFFVEEDVNRIGRTHMGRPIVSPAQVGRESVVYLALIPQIAAKVADRLQGSGIDLRLPPKN